MDRLLSALLLTGLTTVPATSGAEPVIRDITWRIASTLPGACKGQAQAVLGDAIVGVGGAESTKRATDTAWLLDTRTMRYTLLPRAPVVVSYPQGAAVGNDFYLFTGSVVQPAPGRAEKWSNRMFRLSRSSGAWQWAPMPPLRIGRLFPGCAAAGTTIVVLGGETGPGSAQTAEVEAFDAGSPAAGWSRLPEFPGQARQSMAVAAIGRKIYVFGGMKSAPDAVARYAEAWVLDLPARQWTRLPDLPFPAFGWEAVVYRDRWIVMAGGIAGSATRSAPNFDVVVFDAARPSYATLPTRIPPYEIHPERYITWLRPALVDEVRRAGMDPARGTYRHGPELSIVGDTIYLCGGEVVSPDMNITCEVLLGTLVLGERASGSGGPGRSR